MEGRLGRQAQGREGAPVIRFTSLVYDHPVLGRLASKLNGETGKAMKLFQIKAKELEQTGFIHQAQVIGHRDSSIPPVFGVQSGDPSPSKRVRVFFSKDNGVYALRAICRADEDGKALDVLRSMGYNQGQKTSRV